MQDDEQKGQIDRERFRLWRRNGGYWYVTTGTGAGTKRVSTGTKILSEAEKFRAQFIAGLENPAPPSSATIDYLLDRYRNEHGVKTRTLSSIDHQAKILKAFFGKLQPHHISNKALQDYADYRRKMGKRSGKKVIAVPVSNGTILREIGTLKAALSFAAGNRWIPTLPPLQSPVPSPPPRDIWLTRAQAKKLIEEAKSEHIRLFIRLALATAARSGAILDLKWEQINFERKLIDFGRGWGNKRRAIVPINNDLLEALHIAKRSTNAEYVIDYFGEPVKSIKAAFRRLCAACNIKASPHVLRHTAATWLVMDGVPLSEVARLLGDNERTVEKVYGKHAPDYLRRAVDALNIGD